MKKIYIYNKCPEMEDTIFYPEPSIKATPKWWKKLPFLNDFDDVSRLGYGMDKEFLNNFKKSKNELKTSTIKGCPAVLDSVSSGYILRAWCDIVVSVNDIYEINVTETPMINDFNPEKGVPTHFDSQEMFKSQEIIKQKSIPKVISPFFVKADPAPTTAFHLITTIIMITIIMYYILFSWNGNGSIWIFITQSTPRFCPRDVG